MLNLRLGAIGFLAQHGVKDVNFGILDQIQALKWVRSNVAAFGGNPNKVKASVVYLIGVDNHGHDRVKVRYAYYLYIYISSRPHLPQSANSFIVISSMKVNLWWANLISWRRIIQPLYILCIYVADNGGRSKRGSRVGWNFVDYPIRWWPFPKSRDSKQSMVGTLQNVTWSANAER